MSKKYFDLNRTRKIYPIYRTRPKFVTMKENVTETESTKIVFANVLRKTYTFQNVYRSIPIVILTPENENVNAYISAIDLEEVTIEISGVPGSDLDCDVYVHLQAFSQE